MPFSRRPVSRRFQGHLVDRVCIWSCMLGKLAYGRRKPPGTAGLSFVSARDRDNSSVGPHGICEVFVEGVGHGNIVCYPKNTLS